MKAATSVAVPVRPRAAAAARPRFADYVALTKPRIAVMVLFTVGAGALTAAGTAVDPLVLLHAVVGTALVAAGASALNMWLEARTDALMPRTMHRPLPAGRLTAAEVLTFGLALGFAGVAYLALTLATPLPALLAGLTFVGYVAVYTPLKPVTTLNTLVGAVPGAMPPVIGYAAVRGELTPEALALFLVLFVWQIPHFLAIAWMYREQYARAGLRMLPITDPTGRTTGHHMIAYCVALLPVSLLPVLLGGAGAGYAVGALVLGLAFLWTAVRFRRERSHRNAKTVLRASLLYLPGLLLLLLLERLADWVVR